MVLPSFLVGFFLLLFVHFRGIVGMEPLRSVLTLPFYPEAILGSVCVSDFLQIKLGFVREEFIATEFSTESR